jgi:hypothetical protein
MRKWLESRHSRSSDLTNQLTESNTKIVRLVLIKKKGKLQFLILWDGLRVGNILEAFDQNFRAVAEVNRIGRLLAFWKTLVWWTDRPSEVFEHCYKTSDLM